MKYDSDLIETIYLLQQNNPALAERMWNRLVVDNETDKQNQETSTKQISLGYGLKISEEVFTFIQRNHSGHNKVAAIRAMREKTGWGLKEAKDAIDRMIAQGML